PEEVRPVLLERGGRAMPKRLVPLERTIDIEEEGTAPVEERGDLRCGALRRRQRRYSDEEVRRFLLEVLHGAVEEPKVGRQLLRTLREVRVGGLAERECPEVEQHGRERVEEPAEAQRELRIVEGRLREVGRDVASGLVDEQEVELERRAGLPQDTRRAGE